MIRGDALAGDVGAKFMSTLTGPPRSAAVSARRSEASIGARTRPVNMRDTGVVNRPGTPDAVTGLPQRVGRTPRQRRARDGETNAGGNGRCAGDRCHADSRALTSSELKGLDLPGRAAAADRADRVIRPLAMSLPGFAGIYQDQIHGGRLVVRFTSVSAAGHAAVVASAGSVDLVIEEGARSTFAELAAASDRVLTGQAALLPESRFWELGSTKPTTDSTLACRPHLSR